MFDLLYFSTRIKRRLDPKSLCYWAVRKLGFSATELSKKLGVTQAAVRISVKRGEKIAKNGQFELVEDYNVII